MTEDSPTVQEARGIYEVARALHPDATGGDASPVDVMAEFDRMIARVERAAAAKALRDAEADLPLWTTAHRSEHVEARRWLTARAVELEKAANSDTP